MPVKSPHDCQPPIGWPEHIQYFNKPRLSISFPKVLIPLLHETGSSNFTPRLVIHPTSVQIKVISSPGHPAHGQNGLFTKKRISGGELIIPYLGIIHHTLIPLAGEPERNAHSDSDYDLSLLRLSASDLRNPFPDSHVSIGVDAAKSGNAARFVNDYRGISSAPNAEFRIGRGESGELRMEIWSLKCGIGKGEEILVSYGKAWWGARR